MLLAIVLLLMLASPLIVRLVSLLVRREWEQILEQRRTAEPGVPIERVAADLRRLRAQLEACENRPGMTGKGMKMGALRAAYVEVLETACCQLEIVPPQRYQQLQTPLVEIYRVEAELRTRGLDVRPPDVGQRHVA